MEIFIKNLAKGAGAILKDGFGKKLKVSFKRGEWDEVTQFDLASDEFIIEKIRKKYPNHGIVTEESGHLIKKKNFWIIDPLDGTTSFVNNIPGFCVSIAFVSSDKIKLAAVYAPMTDEMFFAEDKKGSFLNKTKITTSSKADLKHAAFNGWMETNNTTRKEKLEFYKGVVKNDIRLISNGGSYAMGMCMVACGRHDGTLSKGIFPWDYAAGALIIKEAGAKVTDFQGKPYQWKSESIVGANPVLHKKIMKNFKLS